MAPFTMRDAMSDAFEGVEGKERKARRQREKEGKTQSLLYH